MVEAYQPQEIESKWQAAWEKEQVFKTPPYKNQESKQYILDFFPYPSGAGLHVGHIEGYTGTDIVSRVARMQGKQVLHPIGWDAFGLPAENYAIKSGVHPAISTKKNSDEFRRQIKRAGLSYDWDKEFSTSDPEYYKWTQWFFALLYERGLAYRKEAVVNWCPSCQTVLANEQVVNGRCERCGTEVIQKMLKQWYFKITDYAERLLKDLDTLDWPENIKQMQRNWIGKSAGATINFQIEGREEKIEIFTTRPDTLFGATYLVLAPEHSLVKALTTEKQKEAVRDYQERTSRKTELERSFLEKEKTGVFTGSYAINPATEERIPIWLADYVILSYGTGAIMAVPAHDERDKEFAAVYKLPIVEVVSDENRLINSADYSGLPLSEAKVKLAGKFGKETTTYRLRDWLISRQRFWGAPIPIVYDKNGGEHLLPFTELPVLLPENVEFLPTGQSPLALATDWNTYENPESSEIMRRETDTLDGFVCSSWYFLRFPTPHLASAAFDKEEVAKWLPVDIYVGGAEHAVLHLLYARFFTKVLFDAGYLSFEEPFRQLRNPGTILGPDHNKMSKSKGNVINPDDVIDQYGADTLRLYEMFMGPFESEKPWSTSGIIGVRRFLEKIWRLQEKVSDLPATPAELRSINLVIKKVTEDTADFKFNTAVSALMECSNALSELESITEEGYQKLLLVLNPFAPFITEELWMRSGQKSFCSVSAWPSWDAHYVLAESVEYPVQVNGKVRFKLSFSITTSESEVLKALHEHPHYLEIIAKQAIKKEIIIPGRLISLVV